MRLRDIKKGQHFAETDCGLTIICEALEDAQRVEETHRNGHTLRGRVMLGTAATADADGIVHFFEDMDAGPYGLRLHDDAAIDVWRVSYGGSSYLTDQPINAKDEDKTGATIEPLKMSRNRYLMLPEFTGF